MVKRQDLSFTTKRHDKLNPNLIILKILIALFGRMMKMLTLWTSWKKRKQELENEEAEERKKINDLILDRERLEQEVKSLSLKAKEISLQQERASKEIAEKLESMRLAESGFGVLEEIGYERYVPTTPDDILEGKIYWAENKMARMAGEGTIIQYNRIYRIDGSETKGKKFQEAFGKNLLIGFNTYVQTKTKSITDGNYYNTCDLIKKSFDKYNKQGEMLGIGLNQYYLNLRLEILQYTLELKIKKAKEKAQLREERKRMREQEKLLEEIAKEQEQLEKERKSMDIAFAKALTDTEREKIKAQMNKIDKRMDDLKYRKEHNNSGWLYVISSPSLPNMCKVGCTRRLNPTIRVKELSSASLPYAFRTHGFVFSDNCFELETQMHHYFDDKRVAPDREFFYITPQEAIDVLKNKFHQEVHFEDVESNHEQDSDC